MVSTVIRIAATAITASTMYCTRSSLRDERSCASSPLTKGARNVRSVRIGAAHHRWRARAGVRWLHQKGGDEDDQRRAREVPDRGTDPRGCVGAERPTAWSSPCNRAPGACQTAGWGGGGPVVIAVQALGRRAS